MQFTNHTGLENNSDQVIEILQIHLASVFDLYSQLKQAHWNVKGPGFYGIHKMFDGLAEQMESVADLVAERISALGGYPMGHVSAVVSTSILDNPVDDLVQDLDWVAFILDQFHTLSKQLYLDINTLGDLDPVSEDLLISIAKITDQSIYFLASHLEDNSSDEFYETGAKQSSGDELSDNDEEVVDDGSDKVL